MPDVNRRQTGSEPRTRSASPRSGYRRGGGAPAGPVIELLGDQRCALERPHEIGRPPARRGGAPWGRASVYPRTSSSSPSLPSRHTRSRGRAGPPARYEARSIPAASIITTTSCAIAAGRINAVRGPGARSGDRPGVAAASASTSGGPRTWCCQRRPAKRCRALEPAGPRPDGYEGSTPTPGRVDVGAVHR